MLLFGDRIRFLLLVESFFLSFFVSKVNMTFSCFHVFTNSFKVSFKA